MYGRVPSLENHFFSRSDLFRFRLFCASLFVQFTQTYEPFRLSSHRLFVTTDWVSSYVCAFSCSSRVAHIIIICILIMEMMCFVCLRGATQLHG